MSVFDYIMKKSNAPIQRAATNIAEPAARPQQLSYVDMLNKMYTPETAEEKAKRERKEKWDKTAAAIGDGISALANLYYTTKGAPNSYDGKNSMSERTRQLYERLDKDRKENERWYLNHYMNAAKMDEDAKRYADERDYKRGRDKVADDRYNEYIEHRNAREAVQDANTKWQQEFQKSNADWQHDNTEKQQAEQKRQFWANHNMQVQNIKRQLEKENPTIDMVLGDGKSAKIKKQALNAHNVSYVYNKLPQEIRDKYATEPVYDKNTGFPMPNITKPRKLTQDDMMAIIGEHIAQHPDVQKAWKEVGGEITTSTQQSGGGGKHSHRVGGNNSTTDV